VAVLLGRWWLVAGSLLMALGLAFLYHRTTPPLYESSAQLLVVKKLPDAVTGVDTRALSLEDYVATHQTLLHSPLLVGHAVRKHDLANLEGFADQKEVTEAIRQGLGVTRNKAPGGNTDNVLNLFFYGPIARECPLVLDALIDSFKDHLEETYRTITQESCRLMAQARSDLHQELLEKEAAYRKFRKETPLLLLKGKDETLLRQDQLSAIETKRSALRIRQAELRGQLSVLDTASKEGGNREALVALVTGWTAQADAARGISQTTMQDRLLPLLAEEQKLLETRGEKHPDVELLRKRIEATRRLLAAPATPWRALEPGKHPGDPVDPVEAYRLFCKQELQHLEISDQYLGELYQKEHTRARELTTFEVEDEGYRTAIERQQRLYDTVIKQLQQLDLAKDLGGYDARVIAPPGPGKKIRPNALVLLPGAAFLGLLGGFGLAFLAEIRDKRLRSAEEIRSFLGLPVLAHVPHFPTARRPRHAASVNGALQTPPLGAYHRPASGESEAYRRVRTALCFGLPGDGCRVVQVTSPNDREGSTLLAANLAVSLAQAGRRVLLIDANLRRPQIHELFGLTPEPGLGTALTGTVKAAKVLQPGGLPGLWVLPAGPPTPDAADLLTAPGFQELLTGLRDQFEFVIVDTPGLLGVTDACAVAPRVDAVLLNLRVGKNSRRSAQRAAALLAELDVHVAGVVVNDVSRRGRGGYRLEPGSSLPAARTGPT
jgi:capsular exopolysaccharide synthesis family protein